MRENLVSLSDSIVHDMNYEQLFIEARRELEKAQLECSHLKHKMIQKK
jgi:hypothetical protein